MHNLCGTHQSNFVESFRSILIPLRHTEALNAVCNTCLWEQNNRGGYFSHCSLFELQKTKPSLSTDFILLPNDALFLPNKKLGTPILLV